MEQKSKKKIGKYLKWLQVSKSQKYFFLGIPLPKEETKYKYKTKSRAEFCQIFRSFFGQWHLKKNALEIY